MTLAVPERLPGRPLRERSRRVKQAALEALECRRLLYGLSVLANFDMTTGTNPQGGVIIDKAPEIFTEQPKWAAASTTARFSSPLGATTITPLASFNAPQTGSLPQGNLLIDAEGNLFGTASNGGSGNVGTVFELSKTGGGSITELAEFEWTRRSGRRSWAWSRTPVAIFWNNPRWRQRHRWNGVRSGFVFGEPSPHSPTATTMNGTSIHADYGWRRQPLCTSMQGAPTALDRFSHWPREAALSPF